MMDAWPSWWNFELIISPHMTERMEERGLSEIDLRIMLDDATGYDESAMPGRFVIGTTLRGKNWQIVVELDELEELLIIVTAYRVESEAR